MRTVIFFFVLYFVTSCNLINKYKSNNWTKEELAIIESESPLYVLNIDNEEDTIFLRKQSSDFSKQELLSQYYTTLCEKMVLTVCDPSQDGVGIAGPQVGISKRIVAVQRFDKENEPFEVYPNIKITAKRGELEEGSEGCLSVPNRRGVVERYHNIDITYSTINKGIIKDTTETIQGFTAVIFQHECDHLDGKLYIDYL